MEHAARLPFLFDKYLAKRITASELEEMLRLMKQADAGTVLTPAMLKVWEALKEDNTEYEVDWNKMFSRISAADPDRVHPLQNTRARFMWYKAAAAVLMIALGGAIYWIAAGSHPEDKTMTASLQQHSPHEQPKKFQTIHLPDGSTVILNINSKLDYPAAFKGAYREVTLTGEGFFDIQKDARMPFLVHTGNITTKVLGTTFNIKAYPADEAVKVTVASGKVQLLKDEKNIGLLTANEQLTFSKGTGYCKKGNVDAAAVITWKPADMEFDDATLAEAARSIHERFGTEIIFANNDLRNCRVTAGFSGNDTPEEMVAVLCGVSNASYTILNNKITIYGKGCK